MTSTTSDFTPSADCRQPPSSANNSLNTNSFTDFLAENGMSSAIVDTSTLYHQYPEQILQSSSKSSETPSTGHHYRISGFTEALRFEGASFEEDNENLLAAAEGSSLAQSSPQPKRSRKSRNHNGEDSRKNQITELDYSHSLPPNSSKSTPPTSISVNQRIRPVTGTAEWHQIRKENHKEVERRRREIINEGINELAKIVPGEEKHKGSIISCAVKYINELKKSLNLSHENFSIEKSKLNNMIGNLNNQLNDLKDENKKLREFISNLGLSFEIPAVEGHARSSFISEGSGDVGTPDQRDTSDRTITS